MNAPDQVLSEDDLACAAYEAWRADLPDILPHYRDTCRETQIWWYNRVGVYLELPWPASAKETPADRHVRETCQQHGGLDADRTPFPATSF